MGTSLAAGVVDEAITKYGCPIKYSIATKVANIQQKNIIEILEKNNIQISMNGKGRSIDNVIIERFFKTLKHDSMINNEKSKRKAVKICFA